MADAIVICKQCSSCERELGIDQFWLGQRWCKECARAYSQRRKALRKRCKKCGDEYVGDRCGKCARVYKETRRNATAEKEKAYFAAYYKANAARIAVRDKEYRKANAEHIQERGRLWRAANQQLVRERKAAYYARNRKRIRAKQAATANRDEARRRSREWREANRDRYRIQMQNRRARTRGGRLSSDIFARLMDLQRGKCACCRARLTVKYAHLDHIVALANGGRHADGNMQLLCPPCNRTKHTKDPIDFMRERGFLL
jgi:5-methylcytosine-specific restriction endonuclease McrA